MYQTTLTITHTQITNMKNMTIETITELRDGRTFEITTLSDGKVYDIEMQATFIDGLFITLSIIGIMFFSYMIGALTN